MKLEDTNSSRGSAMTKIDPSSYRVWRLSVMVS